MRFAAHSVVTSALQWSYTVSGWAMSKHTAGVYLPQLIWVITDVVCIKNTRDVYMLTCLLGYLLKQMYLLAGLSVTGSW